MPAEVRRYSILPNHVNKLALRKNQGSRKFFYIDLDPYISGRSTLDNASTTATWTAQTDARIPLTFSGGGGHGAAGYASVDAAGTVTGTVITAGGSGYTSAPTVALGRMGGPNHPQGSGTTLGTPTISGGAVTGVPVTVAGTGWDSRPRTGSKSVTGNALVLRIDDGSASANYTGGAATTGKHQLTINANFLNGEVKQLEAEITLPNP